MGKLTDAIKEQAEKGRVKIQDSECAEIEKMFNRMFYLDKVSEEAKFVKHVMTRGMQTQERYGLHASSIIESEKKFCPRAQVLSLFYKQIQSDNIEPRWKRVFEEGNAIHEKWQRLFLRAGYAKIEDLDNSRFNEDYDVSFTPDAIIDLPPSGGFKLGKFVVEIKSMNTFQFMDMVKKNREHPSGKKQNLFYQYLEGVHQGIVLVEDKNNQEFKVFVYRHEPKDTELYVDRLDFVQEGKQRMLEDKKMVKRHSECGSRNCKKALECNMRNACWNTGFGRVLLEKWEYLKE